jgi:hypothetical protein
MPQASAAPSTVFHASQCQASVDAAPVVTPSYTNGEVDNQSALGMVILYCPISYDAAALPSGMQIIVDGWSNGCFTANEPGFQTAVCKKSAGGFAPTCGIWMAPQSGGSPNCTPNVYHLINNIPAFTPGDSLYVKVKLDRHMTVGGDNTMFGYKFQ